MKSQNIISFKGIKLFIVPIGLGLTYETCFIIALIRHNVGPWSLYFSLTHTKFKKGLKVSSLFISHCSNIVYILGNQP